MSDLGFNPNEYEGSISTSFEPLPAGSYPVQIVETETKTTNAGNGTYLKTKFEVVDGEYKGRKFFQNFNLTNANETAERIGRQHIKAILDAIGKSSAKNSQEMLFTPFMATLVIKQGGIKNATTGERYGDSNAIDGVEPMGTAPAQAQANAPAGGAAPWSR